MALPHLQDKKGRRRSRRWLSRLAGLFSFSRRPVSAAIRKVLYEPIEPRLLLSADVSPFAFDMDPAANDLTLRLEDLSGTPTLQLLDNNTLPGAGQVIMERSLGAADNEDTFVLHGAGSISGVLDGGPGGFDTLVIEDKPAATFAYTATGPDPGTVSFDGESVIPPADFVINLSGSDDQAVVELDPINTSNLLVRSLNGSFEEISFMLGGALSSVTIDAGDGDDSVTFSQTLNVPGLDITVLAETITVDPGITVIADDISFTATATEDGAIDTVGDLFAVDGPWTSSRTSRCPSTSTVCTSPIPRPASI